MFRTLIIFTPFMVCLFWFVIFALRYRSGNPAKRTLTWFLLVCTVLYFCHALYFAQGPERIAECIWALCSLSVFPIYWLYIKALTDDDWKDGGRKYLVLLPGFLAFLVFAIFPGKASNYLRIAVFTLQIVFVCLSGVRKLKDFDKLVESSYADADERGMRDVRNLLWAFVLTSVISAVANFLGRTFFTGDDRLLFAVAILFSTMLFALSYIGYSKDFTIKELSEENTGEESGPVPDSGTPGEGLGRALDNLMKEEKLYLVNGLKIADVAGRIGSCRTYLSNYLNRTRGESFSDYVNRLRIEEAKAILSGGEDIKNISLAARLGFSNEQNFYRNFRKFTGMTPAQWKASKA